jgi:hypothetical protein
MPHAWHLFAQSIILACSNQSFCCVRCFSRIPW